MAKPTPWSESANDADQVPEFVDELMEQSPADRLDRVQRLNAFTRDAVLRELLAPGYDPDADDAYESPTDSVARELTERMAAHG